MLTTDQPKLAAVPLAEAPDVVDFLDRLGLGALDDGNVSSYMGRSDIWAGVTNTGEPVFVKRLVGAEADVRLRLLRMEAMSSLLQNHPVLRTPRCLGIDESARLAAFALLQDAVTAAELIAAAGLSEDLAYEAGRMVGALHELTPPEVVAEDRSEPPLPPTGGLEAIPLAGFLNASAAELEVWAILHNDSGLADAISRVRERERGGQHVPTHGDLRLDQLLRHGGRLYLADWEECRLADPARDVGAFIGECLYRSVLGMASTKHTGDPQPGADDLLANGVREFATLLPLIESFWGGYRQQRLVARDDEDLAVRAVSFAGWHMFDRALATGHRRSRLSPLERAAAGVGRTTLLHPDQLTRTLGLRGGR